MSESKNRKTVFYLSDVDLSLGKGPSVNELEFVDALLCEQKIVPVVAVPKPSGEVRSHIQAAVRELLPFSVRRKNPLLLLCYEVALLLFIARSRLSIRSGFAFFRISFFPLGLFLGAPLIANSFHLKTIGDGSFRYMNRVPFGSWLIQLHRAMYRRIMKYAHSADMVTEMHRSEFIKNIGFEEKLFVVPNRVNTDIFFPMERAQMRERFGLSSYEFVYGYVGNDPFNRGAKEAIMALPHVRRDGFNAAVMIVGELKPSEAEWLEQHCVMEHVFLMGAVPYASVPQYMNAMNVGVSFLPAWHRGASEQKVRQYLACGVVPVVTPGGSDFVAQNNVGFVVENDNINRLSEVIVLALMESSKMAVRCRHYAERELSHLLLVSDRMKVWS